MFSFIGTLLISHWDIILGYAICVLFPIPFLNSAIISLWAKFGSSIKTWISGEVTTVENKTTTTVVTPVVTSPTTADISKK